MNEQHKNYIPWLIRKSKPNKLHAMFLDWFNNFLTVPRFAEYYGISIHSANRIINLAHKKGW